MRVIRARVERTKSHEHDLNHFSLLGFSAILLTKQLTYPGTETSAISSSSIMAMILVCAVNARTRYLAGKDIVINMI